MPSKKDLKQPFSILSIPQKMMKIDVLFGFLNYVGIFKLFDVDLLIKANRLSFLPDPQKKCFIFL